MISGADAIDRASFLSRQHKHIVSMGKGQSLKGSLVTCALLLLVACPGAGTESPDATDIPVDAAFPDAEVIDGDAPDALDPDAMDPDATEPDADPVDTGPPIDAGFRLQAASLTPASSTSSTSAYRLQGSLRITSPGTSSTSSYQLRGGLRPTGP